MTKKLAPCLMIQGTSSHVGKSIIVTALCRIFYRMGYQVAPFKSQNMSNNAYVTIDGREIGRAQGVQAEACGVFGNEKMNPILLKPSSDGVSQIVLNGKAIAEVDAKEYRKSWVKKLWPHVKSSLKTLREENDLVIIEGAGSPSEVNLRKGDIANMTVAKECDAKVFLVGDIERGGMLASIVGTFEIIPKDESDLISGIIVNKFRGDKSLLDPGLTFLEEKTGKPVLGVLPYFNDRLVEEEDSVGVNEKRNFSTNSENKIKVGVVKLPRISNSTDFEPLEEHPDIELTYMDLQESINTNIDCVILPGTKATRDDLRLLMNSNLYKSSQNNLSNITIVGICGGFQMLGNKINDLLGVEGEPGESLGLNLLPVETNYNSEKQTERVELKVKSDHLNKNIFSEISGSTLTGYEIHMGEIYVRDRNLIWLMNSKGDPKGVCSENGKVIGTFLHGIFDNHNFVEWFIKWVKKNNQYENLRASTVNYKLEKEKKYNQLADYVESSLDITKICQELGLKNMK
ncbi:cobyric acid synthase [Natranaerobius trueperi]|uniref:Cobyric acid synthase n=1 Tax=Natranaerobius trueperi TaxID=759412 RepID=A0A226BXB0_9FIRM|nr:cobyric acid synthase [Natranaerobius trueperi]OWZ82964.1 cobyric acid synthase CobQ [Natranaerobius trueperi]